MSEAPMSGYRPGECFVGAARKASRRLSQFYDEALEPSGLVRPEYAILAELARSGEPPTLAELASALVSDRSAVGHNLRPLVRDGYVAVEPGVEDRRERRIVLTARGQRSRARRKRCGRRLRTSFSRSMAGSAAKACAPRFWTSPTAPAGRPTRAPRHDAGRSDLGVSRAAAPDSMGDRPAGPRAAVRLRHLVHDHARLEHRRGVAPAIAHNLNAAFADIEWVVSSYVLTFAALLMPAGALADRYGRRRLLAAGLALFTLASLLCGLAPTPPSSTGRARCRASARRCSSAPRWPCWATSSAAPSASARSVWGTVSGSRWLSGRPWAG